MTPHNLHCTAQSPAVLVASFSGHIQLWTDFTAAAAEPQQASLGVRGSKITSAALVALPGRTSHGNRLAAIFGTQQGEVYGLVAVTGEMGQIQMLQPAETRGGLVREPAKATLLLPCSLTLTSCVTPRYHVRDKLQSRCTCCRSLAGRRPSQLCASMLVRLGQTASCGCLLCGLGLSSTARWARQLHLLHV